MTFKSDMMEVKLL